jgi:hypothetical protein
MSEKITITSWSRSAATVRNPITSVCRYLGGAVRPRSRVPRGNPLSGGRCPGLSRARARSHWHSGRSG